MHPAAGVHLGAGVRAHWCALLLGVHPAAGVHLGAGVRAPVCIVALLIAANHCKSILNRFPLLLVASRCV